jgi:hypothetical protein
MLNRGDAETQREADDRKDDVISLEVLNAFDCE